MEKQKHYDVIIIGGSYAGLSAAMSLGRFSHRVLVIDSGLPCNRQTPQSHNLITHDGRAPKDIVLSAKEQVLKYPGIDFYNDLAIHAKQTGKGFEIETRSGKSFHSTKLIFATGIKDILPAVEGAEACWGISLIHCPYCHGYEYKSKITGILGNGDMAMHLITLVRNLSSRITLLTNGPALLSEIQKHQLVKHRIPVVETQLRTIQHKNGYIKNLIFENNSELPFDAVYAKVAFEQHCHLPETLGCSLNETGYLSVDKMQQTSIEGIYACGDNMSPMRSVANAIASGNFAGAAVNAKLCAEKF